MDSNFSCVFAIFDLHRQLLANSPFCPLVIGWLQGLHDFCCLLKRHQLWGCTSGLAEDNPQLVLSKDRNVTHGRLFWHPWVEVLTFMSCLLWWVQLVVQILGQHCIHVYRRKCRVLITVWLFNVNWRFISGHNLHFVRSWFDAFFGMLES